MKRLFYRYQKSIITFTTFFFPLLFATIKTNAQWIELGDANGTPFPSDKTGGNYIRAITTDAVGNVYAWNSVRQNLLYTIM